MADPRIQEVIEINKEKKKYQEKLKDLAKMRLNISNSLPVSPFNSNL